jgi:hypothetical protein
VVCCSLIVADFVAFCRRPFANLRVGLRLG